MRLVRQYSDYYFSSQFTFFAQNYLFFAPRIVIKQALSHLSFEIYHLTRQNQPKKQNIQLIAYVSGQVHGVFYRANTQKKALELGLVGYVRNTAEGVEVVAEGSVKKID